MAIPRSRLIAWKFWGMACHPTGTSGFDAPEPSACRNRNSTIGFRPYATDRGPVSMVFAKSSGCTRSIMFVPTKLSPSGRTPGLLYRELTVLNVAGTVSIMKNRTDIFASASVQQ